MFIKNNFFSFSLFIFTILFLVSHYTCGQLLIQGQVLNGANQEPLQFANVFLSGTTRGTRTDENGSFSLNDVPPGKFDLIVSFVGFMTLKTTIQTQSQQKYRFILKPIDIQLNDVAIVARRKPNPDRSEQLDFFIDNFIGKTQNAKKCKLLNPEVLSFSRKGDSLVAKANEALINENYALGYKLKIQLDAFTYNYALNRLSFEANPVFEPIKSRNLREAQRWYENRRIAYFGSVMHFGRSLYKHELAKEGFTFQRVTERWNNRGELKMIGLPGDTTVSARSLISSKKLIELPMANYKTLIDSVRSTPTEPVIVFTGLIQVIYTKEKESYEFQRERRAREDINKEVFQRSLLRMLVPSFTVEPNGQFWPPHSFRAEGYWTWELLADDLPFDYDPNDPIKE